MNNKVLITIISVITIVAFLFGAYKLTNTQQATMYPDVNVIKSDDHLTWSKDKKNILVEYSDLQCPACKAFHDMIKAQIENTAIPKKVTFVYRHFPLSQVHVHAEEAGYAAEAAGKQGKFFQFADILFANQTTWESSNNIKDYFLKVAKDDLKLDVEKFKKDMDSKEAKDKVQNDYASGLRANVNATPTFYLNGAKLDNIRSFDDFKSTLNNLK